MIFYQIVTIPQADIKTLEPTMYPSNWFMNMFDENSSIMF